VRLEGLHQSGDIGNGTRDLPPCSIVPQPNSLPRAPPKPQTYASQGQPVRLHVLGSFLSLGLDAWEGPVLLQGGMVRVGPGPVVFV
jgi:hypothetical protein